MTVGDMLHRIESRELTEWMAYAQVEPFGEERADLRAGIVAATIANANRDPKKHPKPFQTAEFMPLREKHAPTDDELAAKLRGMGAPV